MPTEYRWHMDRSGRQGLRKEEAYLRAGRLEDGRDENVRMNGSLPREREGFLCVYRSYEDNLIRYRPNGCCATAVIVGGSVVMSLIVTVIMC